MAKIITEKKKLIPDIGGHYGTHLTVQLRSGVLEKRWWGRQVTGLNIKVVWARKNISAQSRPHSIFKKNLSSTVRSPSMIFIFSLEAWLQEEIFPGLLREGLADHVMDIILELWNEHMDKLK